MASEPPAPDLGAIRARLETSLAYHESCGDPCASEVETPDLRALLNAYDAQAARLAAVTAERDQQTALVCQWDERDHAKTVQLARLAALEAAARRLAGHHGPVHCNCQACKQFRDAVAALDEMEKLAE